MSSFRAPKLTNPDIVIRLAQSLSEIEEANQIVYRNYVGLYWADDPQSFKRNKYVYSRARCVFVAVERGQVVGTMSIIRDSNIGLPSDTSYSNLLQRYRDAKDRLAEIMCFAIDRSVTHPTGLTLFLIKFLMQYSIYCAGLDRLVASCRPRHASFYERRLCFEKLTEPVPHAYAGGVPCQLLTLRVAQARMVYMRRYGAEDPSNNLYRFLFVDKHPNVLLPNCGRSRSGALVERPHADREEVRLVG